MIEKELIFISDNVKSKDEALGEMMAAARRMGYINSIADFSAAVRKREEEFPTSIGHAIAIPHGKSDTVIKPFVAFMKTEQEFQWSEDDGGMVRYIFLLGVPEAEEQTIHLKILSQLSRQLLKSDFRDKLADYQEAELFYQLLKDIEKNVYEQED